MQTLQKSRRNARLALAKLCFTLYFCIAYTALVTGLTQKKLCRARLQMKFV
jgi:hypothetical protein